MIKKLLINMKTDFDKMIHATNVLDVGEFEIFRLAYVCWYGEKLDVCFVESAYSNYFRSHRLPLWVRNYLYNLN